jgi:hypothetical protein
MVEQMNGLCRDVKAEAKDSILVCVRCYHRLHHTFIYSIPHDLSAAYWRSEVRRCDDPSLRATPGVQM